MTLACGCNEFLLRYSGMIPRARQLCKNNASDIRRVLGLKLDRLLSFSPLSSDASAETAVQLTGWHVLKMAIIRAANDTGRRETVGIVTETLFLQ